MIDAPFVSFEHESCDEPWTLPDSITFYVSRFTGTPIWNCEDCGAQMTYVECPCDLSHYCHGRR